MRPILLALLLLAPALPADAQTLEDYDYENLAFRGVGVDFGYIWPDRVAATQMYSVRVDLGYVGPGIRIIPSLSYWASEFTDEELDRLAQRLRQSGAFIELVNLRPIKWSDLSLSIDGQLVWNAPLRLLTFLGAGIGFHALNGQGASVDDTFVEDLLDSINAGVAGLAGFEFQPIRRVRVYAEGRYTALNSIQFLSARAGLQFMLGGGGDDQQVGYVSPTSRGGSGR